MGGFSPLRQSLQGNRVWRVETDAGTVLQKQYNVRRTGSGAALRHGLRRLLTALSGRKTSPSAVGRWKTERRLLAHWRASGFDVPADVTDEHAELSGPRILLLEYVPGPSMLELLRRRTNLPRHLRDELLLRFGRAWCARHDMALLRNDPELIQEHGTFDHVLVSGERLVTIDLEQAFRRRVPTVRLVAKEIGGYLRSLAGCTDPETFRSDLRTLVRGYDDGPRLAGVVDQYLSDRPGSRLRQLVERLWSRGSGRLQRKYAVLSELAAVLDGTMPPSASDGYTPGAAANGTWVVPPPPPPTDAASSRRPTPSRR